MQAGELFISNRDGVYQIKVNGRATFDCAPALRNLAKQLEQETFQGIRIDLSECQWMDSTFMGILAMLGLRAKKIGAEVTVLNAGEQNTALLCGLGLKKLFRFTEGETAAADTAWTSPAAPEKTQETHARTVLDAHETLMDVDEQNVRKFGKVVTLVKMDLERSEKKNSPDEEQK